MTAAPTVSTRENLLDVAARLYSERGVFQVSLSEIVRAAGQRNASAIQYHFGDRDALLVALLEPNVRFIGERRREFLDRARAAPDDDRRVVVEALVHRTAGADAYELLAARSPGLDDDLFRTRVAVCVELLGRAASQRARVPPDEPGPRLSGERFVENLIDMIHGAFTAPVTPVRDPVPNG